MRVIMMIFNDGDDDGDDDNDDDNDDDDCFRFGVRDTHCNGDSWSHGSNMPICTSKCQQCLTVSVSAYLDRSFVKTNKTSPVTRA